MSWVRKDDQMPIHRKVAPLSDAAYRLLDEAICWSNRNLTDGAIAAAELKDISARGKPKNAAELVARRLWHMAGEECESPKCPPAGPDGWVIHDYWEYQPSREKALREKVAKAERQRRWIEAQRRRKDASQAGSRDASADGQKDIAPSPPRPEGRRGGSPAVTAARRTAADAGGGGREDQPPPARPPSNGRLSGSPDFDSIARSAVRGERRGSRAAEVRAEIRRPSLPPGRDGGAFDELRLLTTPPDAAIPPEGAP